MSYCIFYSDGLLTWHLIIEKFLCADSMTTSWIEDVSKTSVPSFLVPRLSRHILENR